MAPAATVPSQSPHHEHRIRHGTVPSTANSATRSSRRSPLASPRCGHHRPGGPGSRPRWCGVARAAGPSPASTRRWPACAAPVCACCSPPTTPRPTRAELHRQLAHCGITADDADLLRSADVAAGMLAPGTTALVLGGDGVLEALAARGVTGRARGAGRRRRGGPDPHLHLRQPGPRRDRGPRRRPSRRHQRGRHLPDPRRPGPRGRRPPGRRGHRAEARRPRLRASPTGPRPTPSPPASPTASSGSWWGTGPRPTAPWPPSWAFPSPWSSPGSPGRTTSRPMPTPPSPRRDLLHLVQQALDGPSAEKVLAAS